MGFVATEAVEEMTYDFRPYVEAHGTIPEPSSQQIERFRRDITESALALGLSPEELQSGKVKVEQLGDLMDKAGEVEEGMMLAIADLTGIAPQVIDRLPYRVKAAFSGYIVGLFLNPEV